MRFPLPADNALFDDFVFALNGRQMDPASDVSKDMSAEVTADAGAPVTVDVQYRSRGMRTWTYAFTENGTAQVRDFRLQMRTNFGDVDFPPAPSRRRRGRRATSGLGLAWSFANLISGQAIGMELPERLNPGPFAARVTFFAPVSLLFFLAVMVIVGHDLTGRRCTRCTTGSSRRRSSPSTCCWRISSTTSTCMPPSRLPRSSASRWS